MHLIEQMLDDFLADGPPVDDAAVAAIRGFVAWCGDDLGRHPATAVEQGPGFAALHRTPPRAPLRLAVGTPAPDTLLPMVELTGFGGRAAGWGPQPGTVSPFDRPPAR